MSGCSEYGEVAGTDIAGVGSVQFSAAVPQGTRAVEITPDGFRIMAFKRTSGEGYTYLRDIPMGGMNYDGATLKGTVELPAGDYKFLPLYGLTAPGNYTMPELEGATLSDALGVTHTGGSFPEVFMLNSATADLASYQVLPDGPVQSVSATLRRAVSRVDVLFIRADRNPDGSYTEKAGSDVFGPEKLASANFAYSDANSQLGLSGLKGAGLFDFEHAVTASPDLLTMGAGESTRVGAGEYDFDNILTSDIISGSAHLKGTYLIPNTDATRSTGLTMTCTSGAGTTRTIPVAGGIPVERNKVTIVRVYVLGSDLFSQGVDFVVDVKTAWDGSNFTDVEVDGQN